MLHKIVGFFLLLLLFFACNRAADISVEEGASSVVSAAETDSSVVYSLFRQSIDNYKNNLNTEQVFDDYLKQAEEIALKGDMSLLLAKIYNELGVRYRYKSEFSNALKYHLKAVDIARKLNDCKELPQFINMLAVVYRRIDENNTALNLHFEAMKIAERQGDMFQAGVSLNGVGNVYLSLERYLASIEYFKKAMDIAEKQNNIRSKAINANNIAEAMKDMGNLDSSLVYLNLSLKYNQMINSLKGKSICYNGLGDVYRIKGEYDVALKYLKMARESMLLGRDRINSSFNYSLIGQVYFEMKDYSNALKALHKALELGEKIGSKNQTELSSRWLSRVYEAQNDNSKSLFYLKKAGVYKDSILNERNLRLLATTKAMHDLERSHMTIEQLNKKSVLQNKLIRQQQNTILIVLILFVLLVGIAVLLIWQVKLKSKYNKVVLQQRLLRTQMNPHFIFNALSAIQVFVLENDIEKSSAFLSNFAILMRKVLRCSEYEYVSLEEEREMLSCYLDLQKLRFIPTFDFKIEMSDEIDEQQILIPPMLTQPFVENAIEHGMKSLGGGGKINVRFFLKGGFLNIEIRDNGMGFASKSVGKTGGKKHESMAIKITNQRLAMIRKMSKKPADIKITDLKEVSKDQHGVLVEMNIPVIYPVKNEKILS